MQNIKMWTLVFAISLLGMSANAGADQSRFEIINDSPDLGLVKADQRRILSEVELVRERLTANERAVRQFPAELKTINSGLDQRFQALSGQYGASQSAIAALTAELAETKRMLADESRRREALSGQLATVKQELDASLAAAASRVTTLTNGMKDMRADLTSLNSATSAQRDVQQTLNQSIQHLTSGTSSLDSEVAGLAETVKEASVRLDGRSNELDGVMAQLKEMKESLTALTVRQHQQVSTYNDALLALEQQLAESKALLVTAIRQNDTMAKSQVGPVNAAVPTSINARRLAALTAGPVRTRSAPTAAAAERYSVSLSYEDEAVAGRIAEFLNANDIATTTSQTGDEVMLVLLSGVTKDEAEKKRTEVANRVGLTPSIAKES